jgi:membrane protein involved in colicin uptake
MKKLLIAAAAVAGLVSVTGCKNEREKVREERADLAEKRVEAQKDITEIRQEMGEKTAEARKEMSEDTAEVRAEANKNIADVRKDLADERKDVAEAERDLAQARVDDKMTGGSVTGILKSTTGGLTVRDSAGVDYELETNDATKVMHDGTAVKLDDIKEGSEVRASYAVDGEEKVAKDVEVLKGAFNR